MRTPRTQFAGPDDAMWFTMREGGDAIGRSPTQPSADPHTCGGGGGGGTSVPVGTAAGALGFVGLAGVALGVRVLRSSAVT